MDPRSSKTDSGSTGYSRRFKYEGWGMSSEVFTLGGYITVSVRHSKDDYTELTPLEWIDYTGTGKKD